MSPFAEAPLVDSVLHPTDFSEASENAFHHALVLAVRHGTSLTLLHVCEDKASPEVWTQFPSVRKTLERWGLLEKDSPRSAVSRELAVEVSKVALRGRPLKTILQYQKKSPADMIVLATRGLDGLPRWMEGSVSESLADESAILTLFVPDGVRGFVSASDGSSSLERILVAVDHEPSPRAGVEMAMRAAEILGDGQVEIAVVHVGDTSFIPEMHLPPGDAWTWASAHRQGGVVESIVSAADERATDLIIMVTEGRDGILDMLRGTTTEQVLRRAPCPVLAVPTRWIARVAPWME